MAATAAEGDDIHHQQQQQQPQQQQQSRRIILYTLLLLLRFTCTTFTGYIHPDEFFQGGQELFYASHYSNISTNNDYNDEYCHVQNNGSCADKSTTTSLYSNIIPPSWEFEPQNAVRSIVPPLVMVKLPLSIYELFKKQWSILKEKKKQHNMEEEGWTLSSKEIFLVPRLFIALLSIFMMDASIWIIITCKKRLMQRQLDGAQQIQSKNNNSKNTAIPKDLLIFSSSWTALLFLNRPFSNTLETFILSCLLAVFALDLDHTSSSYRIQTTNDSNKMAENKRCLYFGVGSIAIGVLSSAGIFTRFTFAFFALPVVLGFLYSRGLQHYYGNNSSKDNSNNVGHYRRIIGFISSVLKSTTFILLATSFLVTSLLFILLDTQFYNAILSSSSSLPTRNEEPYPTYFITPYNALKYNSNVQNLSEHGIHPRFTHSLVNMTILYGPLVWLFYCRKIVMSVRYKWNSRKTNSREDDDATTKQQQPRGNGMSKNKNAKDTKYFEPTMVDHVCTFVIIFGLGILSLAPHQEPRFLLPLIVPLVVLHGQDVIFLFHSKEEDGGHDSKKRRYISSTIGVLVWIVFNLLLLIFFGLWHQSGVVPSLLSMENIINKSKNDKTQETHRECTKNITTVGPSLISTCDPNHNDLKSINKYYPKAVLYYHTYMPPTFLSRLQQQRHLLSNGHLETRFKSQYRPWPIIDLKGSDEEKLLGTLQKYLSCSKRNEDKDKNRIEKDKNDKAVGHINTTDKGAYVYIVAPPVTLLEDEANFFSNIDNNGKGDQDDDDYSRNKDIKPSYLSSDPYCALIENQNYKCEQVWAYHGHVTTEDMPHWKGSLVEFLNDMQLSYYEISCNEYLHSI